MQKDTHKCQRSELMWRSGISFNFYFCSTFWFPTMITCSYCNRSSCCGPMQREWTHFSLPWGSRVETCSEFILASRQTEMTAWLLRPHGFLPQIHSSGLTERQPQMSQTWRWRWDIKNILGTHPVSGHTTHTNTWQVSISVVTLQAKASRALTWNSLDPDTNTRN